MSDLELCYLSATEALVAFRNRTLSPVELLKAQLANIAENGSDINAFSFLYADEAIAAAREAERRHRDGDEVRPLEGIPVAIKDESLIAGKVTTFGSLIFKDEVASVTSPVNEHLIEAGAVIIGRTTTPEFSCAGFTHSRLWGVTRNPWNRSPPVVPPVALPPPWPPDSRRSRLVPTSVGLFAFLRRRADWWAISHHMAGTPISPPLASIFTIIPVRLPAALRTAS